MRSSSIAVITIISFLIVGCGSKTQDIKIYNNNSTYSSIEADCGNGEANQELQNLIISRLQKKGINLGNDLKIDCKSLIFNEGNRLARWMLPGLGSAKASANIKILDKNMNDVATFNVTANMGAGAFGGSADNALEYLANEIVNQVIQNFNIKH